MAKNKADSSIVRSLAMQTRTRAEVYAERMALICADPQALAQAGHHVKAAMAAALKTEAKGTHTWIECYEADELMDAAVAGLYRAALRASVDHLRQAVDQYRAAGPCRAWDLADALYLSAVVAWELGQVSVAVDSLAETQDLLRAQARGRAWIRCVITVVAVRGERGMGPPQPQVLAKLSRRCRDNGWQLELLALRLLVVEGLIGVGDLHEARRQLIRMRAVARQAGEPGLAMLRGILGKATPKHSLQAVLSALAGRPVRTVGEAKQFLSDWKPQQATRTQAILAARAARLLVAIRPGAQAVAGRARELTGELAKRLTPPPFAREGGDGS